MDKHFQPYPDQWAFLSQIRKISLKEIESIAQMAFDQGIAFSNLKEPIDEENLDQPWNSLSSASSEKIELSEPLPSTVRVVLSNQLYIEKKDLPSKILNRIKRLASFHNPEFYKAQAMRFSTFGKPRVICCAENFQKYLGIPRGLLQEVKIFFEKYSVQIDLQDDRHSGSPIDLTFQGNLHPLQEEAAQALLQKDFGILSATTAFGKTVVAAWLIAMRKVNTLILVHRKQLLDQWKERLATFLNLSSSSIGQIGGGRQKPSGILDLAMIQTLHQKSEWKDQIAQYGQVIIDECHHLSAFSFEQVLKRAKASYILGLTATLKRQDGHQPIILMQCGPIGFQVSTKQFHQDHPLSCEVIPRFTSFQLPPVIALPNVQEIYNQLAKNSTRNDLIFDDLLQSLEQGYSPLVLTERTEHLEMLANRLKNFVKHLLVFKGGMRKRQREELIKRMQQIPNQEERVILATGRYIGEDFDDARLDTLFPVMPISWKGTLQQYVGRLHRVHANKKVVRVYDYVDALVPVLKKMYGKRLKGYQTMGYEVTQNKKL